MIKPVNNTPSFKGTFYIKNATLKFAKPLERQVKRHGGDIVTSFYDGDKKLLILSTRDGANARLDKKLLRIVKRCCKKTETTFNYAKNVFEKF